MDRITINLDDAVGEKLRRRAVADKRSVSDSAHLIIAAAFDPTEQQRLAAELTRLGGCPEMALRNALAELERDTVLSGQPASR